MCRAKKRCGGFRAMVMDISGRTSMVKLKILRFWHAFRLKSFCIVNIISRNLISDTLHLCYTHSIL